MNDERLVALELHAAQQEALLDDLSEVLHTQQREILALQEEVRRLKSRLEQGESHSIAPRADKPPHY